jgi:hypothetical protein
MIQNTSAFLYLLKQRKSVSVIPRSGIAHLPTQVIEVLPEIPPAAH